MIEDEVLCEVERGEWSQCARAWALLRGTDGLVAATADHHTTATRPYDANERTERKGWVRAALESSLCRLIAIQ